MRWVRTISGVLLAIPLTVSGGNYFLHLFPLPPGDGSAGAPSSCRRCATAA